MGILMDDRCDLLVYFVDWPRGSEVADVWWPTLEGLIQLNNRMECPVVIASVLPDGLPADLRLRLVDAGIVTLQGLDDTLSAFSAAACYPKLRAQILADVDSRVLPVPAAQAAEVTTLNEAMGKALLADHGVTVPACVTGTAEEVTTAADGLGYPLAVKLLNANLVHKNIAGAVHLDIKDASGLKHAITTIQASVTRYNAHLDTTHFLIEPMVTAPRAEFIVGVSHKPGVGHALVIGRGGTDVEELKDFTTLLLPTSTAQIEEALYRLHITRRLQLQETDIAALTQTIHNIALFADDLGNKLVELDVNPILLDASCNVTAVDAYLRIKD
jgi:acyl-CoA synthetase (NDP forming)